MVLTHSEILVNAHVISEGCFRGSASPTAARPVRCNLVEPVCLAVVLGGREEKERKEKEILIHSGRCQSKAKS